MSKKKDKFAEEAMKRSIAEEYTLAKKEKRQPRCAFCGELLEVAQVHFLDITWSWDEKQKKYQKNDFNGDASKPCCISCEVGSWDFVDEQEFIFY